MLGFFFKRPIAVLMSILALLLLGVLSANLIAVSLMPEIDIPEVTIQVQQDNMSAGELDDIVLKPLRSGMLQVAKIETISSEASAGVGSLRLSFIKGTDIDYSFIEVNEKIDQVLSLLPREINRPRVKRTTSSDIPAFYLNLTLRDHKANDLDEVQTGAFVDFSQFVQQVINRRIEQLPEVSMVDINGTVSPEVVIKPQYDKLQALGVTSADIEQAVLKSNLKIGNILVRENQYQYNLRLQSSLTTVDDIRDIYLKKSNRLFTLGDLAQIYKRSQIRNGMSLFNGKEAITFAIIKQDGARMDELKSKIYALVAQMEKDYPDIEFSLVRDQTALLDSSINSLYNDLFWGIIFAFIIIFLILNDFRAPISIAVTLPVSITISLLLFYLFGLSINIVSLSGLILSSGLMIDNSIIVIDNITQQLNNKLSLDQACIGGASDIIAPLLSSVLTTCAVFLPLMFLNGTTGALFYEQALALSLSLFVSFLVSIVLLPLLYKFIYGSKIKAFRNYGLSSFNVSGYILVLYEKGFKFTMRQQRLMFIAVLLIFSSSIILAVYLPKEQMPHLKSKEMIVKINWNEPINVQENKKRIVELMSHLAGDIINYNADIGARDYLMERGMNAKISEASVYIEALSTEDLQKIEYKIKKYISRNFRHSTAIFQEAENIFNVIFGNDNSYLTAKLRSGEGIYSGHSDMLADVSNRIKDILPADADPDLQSVPWEQQIVLEMNQENMLLYNVSALELISTLKSAFSNNQILAITDNSNVLPITIIGEKKSIDNILMYQKVIGNDSIYYPVKNFVTLRADKVMGVVHADKRGQYFPVSLGKKYTGKEEDIIKGVNSIIRGNTNFTVDYEGDMFKSQELMSQLSVILLVTILLLYFILSTQFESLVLPLIILLEIPISIGGCLIALYLFGMTLNLMSMLGMIIMCGIVINDSILKIDTVIKLRNQGSSLVKALFVAGSRRLNAILMTSLTTIFALIPVLFTGSLGADLQKPLAVALIGGMVIGTFVSLFVIPLIYFNITNLVSYVKEKIYRV